MIIISSKPGQLGNSLFLFAHFIGFALEKSGKEYRIANPAFNQYADYFESTIGDAYCHFPKFQSSLFNNTLYKNAVYRLSFYSGRIANRLGTGNRFVKCIYLKDEDGFDLCNANNELDGRFVFIQGWKFRCPEYFCRHRDVIKKFFTPVSVHLQRIDELMLPAKNNSDLLIGIHIRHGDYKNFEGGKYYYSLDQYKVFMQRASALFPGKKITFLVCSNSNENMDVFSGMNVIRGTNHEVEDLYAFSKCNYLIGPPSTYTMWASFYGEVPLCQVHNPEFAFTFNDFKVVNS